MFPKGPARSECQRAVGGVGCSTIFFAKFIVAFLIHNSLILNCVVDMFEKTNGSTPSIIAVE